MSLYNLNDFYSCYTEPYTIYIDNINFNDNTVSVIVFRDVLNGNLDYEYSITNLNYYFIPDHEGNYKFKFRFSSDYPDPNIFYMILESIRENNMEDISINPDLKNKLNEYVTKYSSKERPVLKNISLSEEEITEIFTDRVFFSKNGKRNSKRRFYLRG